MARKRTDKTGETHEPEVRRCPYDGVSLDEFGWCVEGNGYPRDFPCPFVCPFCRRRLEWSGACLGCHGTRQMGDRESWTFPGARHETCDEFGKPLGDGQHFVKVADGPRAALRRAELVEMTREIQAILADSSLVAP